MIRHASTELELPAVPARLGGDGFCVLMAGASAAQAEALIRRTSAKLPPGVTFSWGLALSPSRE